MLGDLAGGGLFGIEWRQQTDATFNGHRGALQGGLLDEFLVRVPYLALAVAPEGLVRRGLDLRRA